MGNTLKGIKFNPRNPGSDSVKVSSDYGMRTIILNGKKSTRMHNGIDLTDGDQVYAMEEGTVTAIRSNIKGKDVENSAGNYIKIKHPSGITSVYYHLAYGTIKVKVGSKVTRGQLIAEEGATGNVTGPHLHLGIYKNGKWVDPKKYLLGEELINVESKVIQSTSKPQTPVTGKTVTYVVKKGDNLSKIAKKYNTSWKAIYDKNKTLIDTDAKKHGVRFNYYNHIYAGQKLLIK